MLSDMSAIYERSVAGTRDDDLQAQGPRPDFPNTDSAKRPSTPQSLIAGKSEWSGREDLNLRPLQPHCA